MIELIVADRCTDCGTCIEVCPANVLDAGRGGVPILARVEDCQTCFMCELYCRADPIYVAPDCDRRVTVDETEVVASGRLGQYRKQFRLGRMVGSFSQRAMADGDRIPPRRRGRGAEGDVGRYPHQVSQERQTLMSCRDASSCCCRTAAIFEKTILVQAPSMSSLLPSQSCRT